MALSDRIRGLRERVESTKESAREKRERQRQRFERITQPVTSRVQSAKQEASATREEAGKLADELGLTGLSLPEGSGELDAGQREARRNRRQRQEAAEGLPMGEPPPALDPMEGLDDGPGDDLGLAPADDTLMREPPEFGLENDRT